MKKSQYFFVFLVFLFVSLITGCGPSSPKVITHFYMESRNDSPSLVNKEGLSIEVKPITFENFRKFPKCYTSYTLTNVYDGTTYRGDDWIILNLPAYELTITNTSGHTIAFSRASIKLQDDVGERYDVMMKSDLIDVVDNIQSSYFTKGYTLDTGPVKSKIKSLKIVDRNFEILTGTTEKVYVTFNIGQPDVNAYNNFMSSKNYFKLMLYDIPILTDDAGNVKKTTNFEFIHNVTAKTDTLK